MSTQPTRDYLTGPEGWSVAHYPKGIFVFQELCERTDRVRLDSAAGALTGLTFYHREDSPRTRSIGGPDVEWEVAYYYTLASVEVVLYIPIKGSSRLPALFIKRASLANQPIRDELERMLKNLGRLLDS